ncbi:MAG: hypothetical protein Q9179_004215 [Wetmoreana sp. 5 TL-2023]
MTDARRIDLNYGHFAAPEFRVLGQPQVLLPPQKPSLEQNTSRPASQRRLDINHLVRAYHELAPSSALLPPLEEASEAITEVNLSNDPALSDQLAFGRALHPGQSRERAKRVPVVAVAGGVARELVRIIQLVPEDFGWDGDPYVRLGIDVFQPRVQGIWSGSGSPVQQLRFADMNGEPTEWLAVRYSGGTSILRVVLRENEVPTSYKVYQIPSIEAVVEFRFELQHIVTLAAERSGGQSHADVCFNPRDPSEFAVVNQSSHWSVWRIKNVFKKTEVWTLEAGPSSRLADDTYNDVQDRVNDGPRHDGWGVVRWISDGAGLLICNRRDIVAIELQDPPHQLPLLDLVLSKTTDWIVDVKHGPTDAEHLFVATTSRIFWIHLALEYVDGLGRAQLNVKILLAWTHFRGQADHGNELPDNPSSMCDPYILRSTACDQQAPSTYSGLHLALVPHEVGGHQAAEAIDLTSQIDDFGFVRCLTVDGNLGVHECLLAKFPSGLRPPLDAPRSLGRPRTPKSSSRIQDDFIMPNGLLYDCARDICAEKTKYPNPKAIVGKLSAQGARYSSPSECQWTLNLEWLADRISTIPSALLREALELVQEKVSERSELDVPGIMSLHISKLSSRADLIDQEVAVGDIDQDSEALDEVLRELQDGQTGSHLDLQQQKYVPTSSLSLTSLPSILHTGPGSSLISTHDALVTSWITSLAGTVPSQIRSKIERMIRGVAAQLQLASYDFGPRLRVDQSDQRLERLPSEGQATFTLPVREAQNFAVDSRQVRAKALEQASIQPASSSQISEDIEIMPAVNLPNPEPTPSLRSQGTHSALGEHEGAVTQRLRVLTNVTSQPPLPPALMGILSHWSVGQNPDDYDWERRKADSERSDKPDEEEEAAAQAKKRRRIERQLKRQSQSTGGLSSQPMPFRPAASQDDPATYTQHSSQQSPMPASQPQPGRHGTRITAKKPKKNRPGF